MFYDIIALETDMNEAVLFLTPGNFLKAIFSTHFVQTLFYRYFTIFLQIIYSGLKKNYANMQYHIHHKLLYRNPYDIILYLELFIIVFR